jgi:hypothetical protein
MDKNTKNIVNEKRNSKTVVQSLFRDTEEFTTSNYLTTILVVDGFYIKL